MSCVVILDGHGDYHAAQLGEHESISKAARELVRDLGLDDQPNEVFAYTRVEETDDPGAARLMARGKTVIGQFRMEDPDR